MKHISNNICCGRQHVTISYYEILGIGGYGHAWVCMSMYVCAYMIMYVCVYMSMYGSVYGHEWVCMSGCVDLYGLGVYGCLCMGTCICVFFFFFFCTLFFQPFWLDRFKSMNGYTSLPTTDGILIIPHPLLFLSCILDGYMYIYTKPSYPVETNTF